MRCCHSRGRVRIQHALARSSLKFDDDALESDLQISLPILQPPKRFPAPGKSNSDKQLHNSKNKFSFSTKFARFFKYATFCHVACQKNQKMKVDECCVLEAESAV